MKKTKKHFKKLVAFLLTLVLCFSLAPSALAADEDLSQRTPDESKQYYMDVTDDEGNIITVWVEENTYYPTTPTTRSTPGQGTGTGGHKVGEIKTVTTKVSNASLGLTSSSGTLISLSAKTALAKIAINASVAAVGSTIAGGVAVASCILSVIQNANIKAGNNGFIVKSTYKWSHFVSKIQGTDFYDWSYVKTTVSTY